jgi:hypothetical protein
MKHWMIWGLAAIAFCTVSGLRAADDAKNKNAIKEIMAKCMKNGMCAKVADGKASEADAKALLAMLSEMSKNKPPKGDAEAWAKKCEAIVAAAQGVVDGKDGAGAALKKAAKCAACHEEHKPQA